MKICPCCKIEKDLAVFGNNKRNPDGLATYCKPCKALYHRKHYKAHPEKWAGYSKNWRTANAQYKLQQDKEYAQRHPDRVRLSKTKYKKLHPEKIREMSLRRRARVASNGVFVILAKELLQLTQRPCFYCGQESKHIDHVIPISRGGRHSIGNLVPSCVKCNLSKSNKFLVEWKVA